MNNLLTTLESAAEATGVAPWIVYTLGGVIMALAIIISVVVAMQSSKEGGGLSGTIAGSASESFFGKSKTLTKDRLLSRITIVLSAVFVVATFVLTILVMNLK